MNDLLANWGIWGWMSFGIVLMVLELFVPGTFMVWFGMGAIITGILIGILAPISLAFQMLIFVIASVISVVFGFFVYAKLFGKNKEKVENLQTGAKRFIGQTFTVTEAIQNGKGKVCVGDTVWLAKSDKDIAKGEQVKVVNVSGTILIVEKK